MNLEQPVIREATDPAGTTGAQEQNAAIEGVVPRAKTKPARLVAWSLWAVSVVLISAALIIPLVTNPAAFADNLLVNLLGTPALLAYATIGAIIAARRPANPIGWIFSATALLVAIGAFAEEYARYSLLVRPGALPGGPAMAWLTAWIQNLGFFLMFTFLLLFFPDGRLPSRRWRITAWLVAAMVALVAFFDAFKAGPVTNTLNVENPLGSDVIGGVAYDIEDIIILAAIMICLGSVVVRFRRARGDERQQLKWFAYAAVLAIIQFAVRFIAGLLVPYSALDQLFDAYLLFTIATFPVAAGIAILKYRLYDIDLLVNRTLVYVPLTAILAGVYSACIALLQKAFVAATGQQSDAAVVLTTLILVSSFTPIKNGLQSVVDRRFKEAPDPTKKLRAFGDQVRAYVQLRSADELAERLLEEVTAAFASAGGAVYALDSGQSRLVCATGTWQGEPQISVTPSGPPSALARVSLGARHNGAEYSEADRAALQQIVDIVARAMELTPQA
jgi:hypothetical protein